MTQYVVVMTFPNTADAYQANVQLRNSALVGEINSAAIVERDDKGVLQAMTAPTWRRARVWPSADWSA